ncbi:BglG family transcription antiterminator [Pelagirhabdus alkalitolerans]|nr:BglG family transcription antiterminator [Pelagirhabdus alkalitolerans]
MITILRELMASYSPLTGDYLANILNVSSRTIREDIKTLDYSLQSNGATIKSTRGTGYQLEIEDDHAFRSYLNQLIKDETNDKQLVDSPDARVNYLIKRFLLAEDYLKLDDLCEEMHISKSTIQSDLRQVRQALKKHDLSLDTRPNYGMKAKGSEVRFRFALSEFVFDRSESSSTSIWKEQLKTLADHDEDKLEAVSDAIMKQIRNHNISLSDIAINNLFIHIVIAYKRIKSGHHVSMIKQELNDITNEKEYHVARKIVEEAEDILNVKFPFVEVAYITIHLLGTRMVSQTNMDHTDIENVLEPHIQKLTVAILDEIENRMSLGIRHDQELFLGLGLHLKPSINRYKYGMNIRNPMLNDIKVNYPLAFESAVIAGIVIEGEIDVSIDENEIGYLALHIGAAIERKKAQDQPIRCYIVCASGLGSAQLIKYKIKAVFGSQVDILGTTEYYKIQQIPFHQTDVIISSVPIKDSLPIPVIEVNTILGEPDINRIRAFVDEDNTNLLEYIRRDFIYLNQGLSTKEEALTFLVDQLNKTIDLPKDYLDLIFEREAIAPTAYGNSVAIPHPVTAQTDQTFLTICTLKKPIEWTNQSVQFICLLNVAKNSQEDLQDMYQMLIKLIEQPKFIQKLIQCQDRDQFLQTLMTYQP